MGCGASSAAAPRAVATSPDDVVPKPAAEEAPKQGPAEVPKPVAEEAPKPGAEEVPKPGAEEVLFKKAFEDWWAAHKGSLFERITEKDFVEHDDDEGIAKSMTQFVTDSLPGLEWMSQMSAQAMPVRTKEHYTAAYVEKLGDRTDVAHDNLWSIQERAMKCIEDGIEEAKDNPTLQALLKEIHKHPQLLSWSQGSFGPKVYTSKFLATYANAMVSGRHFAQKNPSGKSYVGDLRPLECGIFYIDAGVQYPLHFHEELECYFILAGSTDFKWLYEGQVINMERKQGEWHFNYPNVPHAITTPDGKPHLSLWFREGGLGQAANDKMGPKWIGSVDGLQTIDADVEGSSPTIQQDDPNLIGSAGFEGGNIFREDVDRFMRVLAPHEFSKIVTEPDDLADIDQILTPERLPKLRTELGKMKPLKFKPCACPEPC